MCSSYITSIVVIILVVMPAISANAIGCKLACKKCRDKLDHPSIVTVYCEMCDECKAKRDQSLKERMALRNDPNNQVSQAIVEVDNLADCPGPPPCEPEIVKLTKRTTTTTTTTTEPPPRRCPPAPICVLRKTTCPPPPPPPPAPLYPCMQGMVPMCNFMQPVYAQPPQQPVPVAQNQQAATSSTPAAIQEVTPSIVRLPAADYLNTASPSPPSGQDETTEYLSVYVGIPKGLNLPDMDEEYEENSLGSALLL